MLRTKSLLLSSEGLLELVCTEAGSRYWQAIADACGRRKYFSTKGGRIGLGPTYLKLDDNICVLYSRGPLFVLRFDEGKDTAQLVGEAYVQGLMSGEALTMEGRAEDENFILC